MEGTDRLVAYIAETTLDKIPRAAIDTTKRSIMDCIGVALAGSTEDASKIMFQFVRELGGSPMATVIGGDRQSENNQRCRSNQGPRGQGRSGHQ